MRNHDTGDEIMEALWIEKFEDGASLSELKDIFGERFDEAIVRLLEEGKIAGTDGVYRLTDKGEKIAVEIVRRHRLAERLFYDLLGVSLETSAKVGCGFEHFLEDDVTDAVCSFLGHPPVCPHNRPIPRGKCCRARHRRGLHPLIVSLRDLDVGGQGRITFISSPDHKVTDKLFSLGLYPGQVVRLHQKLPSFLVQVDHTEIGLERDVASSIFVRRID
jgi:DtxR family Mn-dependent transcriptional regulator